MEIVEILLNNKKQLVKLGVFLGINAYLLKNIFERKKLIKEYSNIKRDKIHTIEEALQHAKQLEKQSGEGNKQTSNYLIKVEPLIDRNKIDLKRDLYSNQFWCIQPSLDNIALQVTQLLNKAIVDKNRKAKKTLKKQNIAYDLKWKAKKPQKSSQNLVINGFGKIISDNIFQVKTIYYPDQNLGFFKRIYENVAYFFEIILFPRQVLNYQAGNPIKKLKQKRYPSITGPVIGKIRYIFNFVANKNIILKAQIQDGNIIPLMSASSRQDILSYISSQIVTSNLKIFISLVFSLITYRSLYKYWKKKAKYLRQKLSSLAKKRLLKIEKFNPPTDDVTQDRLCIICYSNCRNTILFDCRHIIMCDQCQSSYSKQTCPLCKKEIDYEKILHQM